MECADKPTGFFLISIIIATLNAEKNLEECLKSIRLQSTPVEIVIVDGGSTDQTLTILKNFDYAGLQWISEPDSGIYEALNKGVRRASGSWLYFMGADDLLLPGFNTLIFALNSARTIYYGVSEAYYLPGKKPEYQLLVGKFSRYRLAKYPINHQAILYPADVFKKYQYQTIYKIFADYVLNMQIWGDPSFTRKFLPIHIVKYNMTGISSTMNDTLFQTDKPRLIKKYLGLFIYLRWLLKFYKKQFMGETF